MISRSTSTSSGIFWTGHSSIDDLLTKSTSLKLLLLPPSEDLLKQRQQPVVLKPILEIDFVFLLFYPHFVQHVVMCSDSNLIEVSHHDEILADVSAFESPCEVACHKPADHVATTRDDPADAVARLNLFTRLVVRCIGSHRLVSSEGLKSHL